MTNCKRKHHNDLTSREAQVLEFLKQGDSNKEIGAALNLQVVTIKLHVRGIMRKMDAKNRTHAAVIALANDNAQKEKEAA